MQDNKKNSNSNDITAKDIVNETSKTQRAKMYNKYVKNVTPTHNGLVNCIRAFIWGGAVCVLGQFIMNTCINRFGLDKELSGTYTSIILVLTSIILTGVGVYEKLVKNAGAGLLVPITGFANSVASPAVEYKAEGQVFGIGCKIFTIAGPVILYGIFSSWLLGLGYWVLKVFQVL